MPQAVLTTADWIQLQNSPTWPMVGFWFINGFEVNSTTLVTQD